MSFFGCGITGISSLWCKNTTNIRSRKNRNLLPGYLAQQRLLANWVALLAIIASNAGKLDLYCQWWIPRPPPSSGPKFLHFNAVFEKNWPNNRLSPPWVSAPSSRKSWIRHWLFNQNCFSPNQFMKNVTNQWRIYPRDTILCNCQEYQAAPTPTFEVCVPLLASSVSATDDVYMMLNDETEMKRNVNDVVSPYYSHVSASSACLLSSTATRISCSSDMFTRRTQRFK